MTTARAWKYDVRYADPPGTYTGSCPDLGSNNGAWCWNMTPGTAPASANSMFIFEVSNDVVPAGSFIEIAFTGASSVTMSFNDGYGNSGSGGWDASSSLESGTSYDCKVHFDTTEGEVVFDVDGTPVIEISTEVRWRGNAPLNRFYLGSNSTGGGDYTDTTYTVPDMDTWRY